MTETELLTQLIAQLSAKEQLKSRYLPTIELLERNLAFAKLDKYRTGVIGVTSSGKSTLINAILSDELLSMAVKPSSSQLVSCSRHKERKATIFFQDSPPVEYSGSSLTPQIIKKYTDENYNSGNKEKVKMVELSTPKFALSDDVMLIDSPGLDAYGLDIHETLTLETLLPTIDFCIFVTTMKTNSDEKMKSVLNKIAGYDCPVIIVQNMLDSVKPSPDGKKSVKDVANDHKARVERIVNRSDITNKSSVRVVQLSAKYALVGRMKNDAALLKKSGYNAFINAVSQTLDDIRPHIEARALRSVKERIGELLSQAKQDLNADKEKLLALKFEFEGFDTEITGEFEKTERKLSDILGQMNEVLRDFKKRDPNSFTAEEVDEALEFKRKRESALLDEISRYNQVISKYCKKLGENERRLKKIDSFGAVPELRPHHKTKPRYMEKRGFFSGIARFFGNIFNTDWGYNIVSEEVFDSEETYKRAVEYLERVIQNCSVDCARWLESAESYADQLCGIVKRRYEENEARKADIPDKEAMSEMIEGLEELYSSVPDIKTASSGTVKHTGTELSLSLEEMSADRKALGIYELAVTLKRKISRFVMQKAHEELCCGGADIIVSWDALCASSFLSGGFDITKSEGELKGINKSGAVITAVLPDAKDVEELKRVIAVSQQGGGVNLFVMFNAIQYGEARSALDRLGVCPMLTDRDRVFLVVQDFEELINGDCVCDALRNMREACGELDTKAACSILINSENPVYGLTALYANLSGSNLLIDEVNCLSELKRHLPFLLTRASEREVCEILGAYREQ